MVRNFRREQAHDITWRAEWPAASIGGRVAVIKEKDADRAILQPNTDTPLPWRLLARRHNGRKLFVLDSPESFRRFIKQGGLLETLIPEFLSHEGVAVFTRPCLARATIGKAMRSQGIRTVAEADDNYFAPADQNLFSRHSGANDESRLMHAKAMASMGVNVFSTEWLRDRYYAEYRKLFGKQGLPEMHVCRNHMPSWAWPEQDDYDGPLRVGFMGSPSHVFDLAALGFTTFHAAKELGCKTVMIGYNPADPDPDQPDEIEVDGEMVELRSQRSLYVKQRWGEVVDEHIRWVDPAIFHRMSLPFDIALCPLLSNDFNFGRSDIKGIEAVVNGAVPVMSNHTVFTRGGWIHGVNCLLGGSAEELAMQVVRLIRDKPLREALVEAGREMVKTERNEHVMATEWTAALAA